MKLTFICPVFPPEPAPAGVMLSQLVRGLAADGHDVSVIVSFPNRPRGALYPGFRRRVRLVETFAGVTVVRTPNWILGKRRRFVSRILENFTFALTSVLNAAWQGRPDVLVIESWPFFGVQFALWLAGFWHIPAIYIVQDIYPEALLSGNYISGRGLIGRVLLQWDKHLCHSAARVVAISRPMAQLIRRTRCLQDRDVVVIENWNETPRQERATRWRRAKGVPDNTYLVLYAGTLGHVSGATVLVDVAEQLGYERNVCIMCVGEGVLKENMVRDAGNRGLENIRFEPFEPDLAVPQMLSSADALVLTVQPGYPDASVPSKLISYLAAGRPVVCAVPLDSTAASVVRESGCGLVVPPGEPLRIKDAISFLVDSPRAAAEMAACARRCYEGRFTLSRALGQFRALLNETRRPNRSADQAQHHARAEEGEVR